MVTSNPVYKSIKEEIKDIQEIKKGDIEFLSICLSFLMIISFVLVLSFYKNTNNTLSILLITTSLFLSIFSFIMLEKEKYNAIFSIIYSLSTGLLLGALSLFLSDTLSIININGIDKIIDDSKVFITIASSMISSILIVSIYYYLFNAIRSFKYIYLVCITFSILISFMIIFVLSRSLYGYNFLVNFISSIVSILLFTFILIYYFESVRIKIENGVSRKSLIKLSVLPLTSITYFIFDIKNLLIH